MPTDSLMGYALLAGAVFTPFLITVGLVEAVYFINVAFMALFVFATPGK
ncbi:MAG: synthase subcomplex subunit [Mycobacterium sp.]|jgi:F-type H+-transporting ATPase subunit c|nr:synthase subcomplex subunit [Mycobacterium sp.]MDT5216943.1 F-type H+-transporting ATPase subunit c [Mycobacterium sp.]MDT7758115.1 F-type H+-transporting ATPase subunit c [Mycobacterium sp.]